MVDSKDFELISPERRKQIQEDARKQVLAERRKEAEKLLLQQEMKKFESEGKPELERRAIMLDLPGHAPWIKLDGKEYEHGRTYEVTKPVYDTLLDLAARAWEHEDEVGGANRDKYRKPGNFTLTARGAFPQPGANTGVKF